MSEMETETLGESKVLQGTEIDLELLIDTIQNYLYNVSNRYYKDAKKKNLAWEEIAMILNTTDGIEVINNPQDYESSFSESEEYPFEHTDSPDGDNVFKESTKICSPKLLETLDFREQSNATQLNLIAEVDNTKTLSGLQKKDSKDQADMSNYKEKIFIELTDTDEDKVFKESSKTCSPQLLETLTFTELSNATQLKLIAQGDNTETLSDLQKKYSKDQAGMSNYKEKVIIELTDVDYGTSIPDTASKSPNVCIKEHIIVRPNALESNCITLRGLLNKTDSTVVNNETLHMPESLFENNNFSEGEPLQETQDNFYFEIPDINKLDHSAKHVRKEKDMTYQSRSPEIGIQEPIIVTHQSIRPSNSDCKNTYTRLRSDSNLSIISDSADEDAILDPLEKFQDFESSGSEYILPEESESSEDNNYLGKHKNPMIGRTKKTNLKPSLDGKHVVDIYGPSSSKFSMQSVQKKGVKQTNQDEPDFAIISKLDNDALTRHDTIDLGINQQYIKKPSARERPTICPFCYHDVITHFPRHLFRYHNDKKEVRAIQNLKPNSKERLSMVAALRKQGYFYLKTEKQISNPVRNSKNVETEYFNCTYCLGLYTKKLLYKHIKICKSKPAEITTGKGCLSKSQTFMALMVTKNYEFLQKSRISNEVFDIMRADEISAVAKSDTLICLYGEHLISKHKRQQIAVVVSSRIREMARLLMVLRSMDDDVKQLFDALKPQMFATLLLATKTISGYDENTKSFKAPSLALHMGTYLKTLCNVAFKLVVENRKIPKICWDDREQKKSEIKDLKKLIEGHWCNDISSIALKTLKERQWEKPVELPLTSDILLLQSHLSDSAERAFSQLSNNISIKANYKTLTQCVLAMTVMFNRKRVGDVQYLTIETYNKAHSRNDQEAFTASLTQVEKILSSQFKRVVTGGKGSKPVPILFSERIQKYISYLLNIRQTTNIVPKSNKYLFANPGSQDKWMAGANVIRQLAANCGAQHPTLLTSTKFRKHIATTLQLMSMEPTEMEQIATFMGHTKKTHEEFYRLPQDIYQTAKVAKLLLLLEKGKGKEFQGKSLNEINLDKDVYYSSESSDEDNISNGQSFSEKLLQQRSEEPALVKVYENVSITETCETNEKPKKTLLRKKRTKRILNKNNEAEENDESTTIEEEEERTSREDKVNNKKKKLMKEVATRQTKKSLTGRVRWTPAEKNLVLQYFKTHVKGKITPKKHECDEFLVMHGNKLLNKDWVRVKTLVYNTFREA